MQLRLRVVQACFQFDQAQFQGVQLGARLGQHLRLDIKFLARDQVEAGKALGHHRFHVLLDILGRRVFDGLVDLALQIVKEGIHVHGRSFMVQPVHRTIAVHSGVNLVRILALHHSLAVPCRMSRGLQGRYGQKGSYQAGKELARILLKK